MAGRSQEVKMERQGVNSSGNRKPTITTNPTFSGTNTVGSLQTGVAAVFNLHGATALSTTHMWTRSGVPISGATALTYTQQAGDTGKTLRYHTIVKTRFGTTIAASAGRVAG